eukprot:CAMPEP_0119311670 /NCGR_PEP_ID=MMETSP1333-20130426/23324_1 /TAXON_ID=418940 /ORGANISM="Scyphosphaera apsteinii, Strain RCC1455" /LENGTH=572 /DNA_ID=CAMNT_0007316105 /DNA_START=33 /DNA_END=1751 /DNA_ORIENTATION=+
MCEELAALLDEQHSVTYRWYAQHKEISMEDAKVALQGYASKCDADGLYVVHLLGGITRAGRQEFKLVSAYQLETARVEFSQLTTDHIYSIHVPRPESGEDICTINREQDTALYDQLRQRVETSNCLIDNRWSAIKCKAAVLRKPGDAFGGVAMPAPGKPASQLDQDAGAKPSAANPPSAGQPSASSATARETDTHLQCSADTMKTPPPKPADQRKSEKADKPNAKQDKTAEGDAAAVLNQESSSGESSKQQTGDSSKGAKKRPVVPAGKGVAAMFAAHAARAHGISELKKAGKPAASTTNKPTAAPNSACFSDVELAEANKTRGPLADASAVRNKNKVGAMAPAASRAIPPAAKKQCVSRIDDDEPPTEPSDQSKNKKRAVLCEPDDDNAPAGNESQVEAANGVETDQTAPEPETILTGSDRSKANRKERKKPKKVGSSLIDDRAPAGTPASAPARTLSESRTPPATVSLTADAPPTDVMRTHIVKERVREERTYMDERGYMITEAVWVEREVEKEVPPAAPVSPSPAISSSLSKQPAAIADKLAASKVHGKADKADKAATQGSIKSFFTKK